MILYALMMNVSVAEMFMAGFLPGLFIGACLMGYAFFMGKKHGWRSENITHGRTRGGSLKRVCWASSSRFLVLGGIYGGVFTPTEAAAVSVVYALVVELFVYRELKISRLQRVCRTLRSLSGVFFSSSPAP